MLNRALCALAVVLLAACASSPADDNASTELNSTSTAAESGERTYRADAGPHPVGAIPVATLRDTARNKDLEMYIEYPTKAGPHPLIIWSHGFGGSSRAYVGLSSYWASYGFVVIKPSHADAGRTATANEVWETLTADEHRNRVADITLIIDSIGALEQKYPELQGKIDRERIGVGGHSYGALTAVMAGGATLYRGETPTRAVDTRVDAIVAMSPQGLHPDIGLTERSWADIAVPTLFMTGTNDRGADDREPSWRREGFDRAAAGDKWFISIPGARHASFLGRVVDQRALDITRRPDRNEREPEVEPDDPQDTIPPSADPRGRNPDPMTRQRARTSRDPVRAAEAERGIFATIKTASLAFWDLYLRKEETGRKHLEALRTRTGFDVATR